MLSLDQALTNLEIIINNNQKIYNRNEAQTRFDLIDELLLKCFAWEKHEIFLEHAEGRTYTDYELGSPKIAIIEAKKEGVSFDLPIQAKPILKKSIKSIFISSPEAKEAIEQASRYCQSRGVPIAIVSNGHQFIAFIASRTDGMSVYDSDAFVLENLVHLRENFALAWKLLSKGGLQTRNLMSYLGKQNVIPSKLSSKLVNYPKIRYASELQADLRQLSELFLQDILDNNEIEKDFIKNCYCESGPLSQYSLLSKNILETRYSALFSDTEEQSYIKPITTRKGSNFSPDLLVDALSNRPIVLLGDVGVGKTSFIKNLMYNSAEDQFRKALYIYIDLGSKATLTNDLKEFVLNEIIKQLEEKYNFNIYDFNSTLKGVYASEIEKFAKGVYGFLKDSLPIEYQLKLAEHISNFISNKDEHLKNCIRFYSSSTKKSIIFILDNSDQRTYEIQQETFLISQELAKQWHATVFISVRPSTFHKSKRSGTLNAYSNKMFSILPPRIEQVVSKRLRFALSMVQGKIPLERLQSVEFNASNIAIFFKILIRSIEKNNDIYEFLSNITGGNIREAIDLVTKFIGNPNVDAVKIINKFNEGNDYIIPLHEFSKNALLGDYSHYSPNNSLALNVFDIFNPDPNEHFLTSILLSFLKKPNKLFNNESFCSANVIIDELQNFGFQLNAIQNALRRCTNKKLIETSQRITFEEDDNGVLSGDLPELFRITTIGAYHLEKWITNFSYLDAILIDTPIFNENYETEILVKLSSLDIVDRYNRTIKFREYLLQCWNSISNKPNYFDFQKSIQNGESSFKPVELYLSKTVNHKKDR